MANKKEEIKTDKESITSRFPNIGEIQNCYWQGYLIGNNNDRVPGPSSYCMNGFVKVNDEVLTSYVETYNMKETLISKEPDFTPPDFNKNLSKWFFSDEFNKYMKPLKFSGEFYIDLQNKYIYFSVVDN
jgi:hypothetical protein